MREMRAKSTLSPGTEDLVRRVIGSAIRVHRSLGVGFLESAYREALCLELDAQGIPFEREKPVVVSYRGQQVAEQRIDLVVGGEVIVELKAVSGLAGSHEAQLISYLRDSGLRVGLLMNFHEVRLADGLRRLVL